MYVPVCLCLYLRKFSNGKLIFFERLTCWRVSGKSNEKCRRLFIARRASASSCFRKVSGAKFPTVICVASITMKSNSVIPTRDDSCTTVFSHPSIKCLQRMKPLGLKKNKKTIGRLTYRLGQQNLK